MKLEIKNCNNIDYANIDIIDKKLNIKHGINGTGKTTIANAIEYYIKDRKSGTKLLETLTPFKFRNINTEENKPMISGIESINDIAVFNEEYVSRYVFLEDEILKNSFDVFIKNEEYEKLMSEIDDLVNEVQQLFYEDEELNKLIKDFEELILCFGKTKNKLSAAASIAKGLKDGNKINNIPEELKDYKEYLINKDNIKWLKWQISGNNYIDISCKCPYCACEITENKSRILSVANEYDSKVIEHLNRVLEVFDRLEIYFTEDTNNKIQDITHSINGLSKEQKEYLMRIRGQVEVFYEKLTDLRDLNYFSLKEINKISEELTKYRIDINYIECLNTITICKKIECINITLDKLISKAGLLQGKVNQQNKVIFRYIQEYETEINEFLKYAGYKYNVSIKFIDNEYKMKLYHEGYEDSVENGKAHLSYGEKNALALILFMYETISKNPDLIILDDPISSFDKNKKFAIIYKLFKGRHSFRGNTVLMITHDFDPVIDMIKHHSKEFNEIPPCAWFLENKNGIINEIVIEQNDIKTFVEIAKENISLLEDNLNKLIYLRRVYEINGEKGITWDLLSNIFHKRTKPIKKVNINNKIINKEMTEEEIQEATKEIRKYISNFNYCTEVDRVINESILRKCYSNSKNNYEKLQIYRLINNDNNSNAIIRKFVNETFHIDNDYLYQLNPFKYEVIPQYIIDECDKDLESTRIQ